VVKTEPAFHGKDDLVDAVRMLVEEASEEAKVA
jgi:hypothetical protein